MLLREDAQGEIVKDGALATHDADVLQIDEWRRRGRRLNGALARHSFIVTRGSAISELDTSGDEMALVPENRAVQAIFRGLQLYRLRRAC